MLEVAGRPFVDWQLERLAACGFRDVVMCVGVPGRADPRPRRGRGAPRLRGPRVHVRAQRVGAAGSSARRAPSAPRSQLLEPTFLVTYGDSYLPFDYAEPLRCSTRTPTATASWRIFQNDGQWDASNVMTDGRRVGRCATRRATATPPSTTSTTARPPSVATSSPRCPGRGARPRRHPARPRRGGSACGPGGP